MRKFRDQSGDVWTEARDGLFRYSPITDDPSRYDEHDLPYITEMYGPLELIVDFQKFDQGKPPLSILPAKGLIAAAQVMAHGAEKYGRDNWRSCEDPTRYIDALLRHVYAHNEGELIDPDSGLPHLDHVLCNALFLASL